MEGRVQERKIGGRERERRSRRERQAYLPSGDHSILLTTPLILGFCGGAVVVGEVAAADVVTSHEIQADWYCLCSSYPPLLTPPVAMVVAVVCTVHKAMPLAHATASFIPPPPQQLHHSIFVTPVCMPCDSTTPSQATRKKCNSNKKRRWTKRTKQATTHRQQLITITLRSCWHKNDVELCCHYCWAYCRDKWCACGVCVVCVWQVGYLVHSYRKCKCCHCAKRQQTCFSLDATRRPQQGTRDQEEIHEGAHCSTTVVGVVWRDKGNKMKSEQHTKWHTQRHTAHTCTRTHTHCKTHTLKAHALTGGLNTQDHMYSFTLLKVLLTFDHTLSCVWVSKLSLLLTSLCAWYATVCGVCTCVWLGATRGRTMWG